MACFVVLLRKDGGEMEGKRAEKGEVPLLYILEKQGKEEEDQAKRRCGEKGEGRQAEGEGRGGGGSETGRRDRTSGMRGWFLTGCQL